jgi:tryptophan synthase alpha chain
VPASKLLPNGRRRRPLVVPYLLVDRSRRTRVGAYARALADGGAAALELGFPFSDPIADGPVLEAAAGRALAAGTRWDDLIDALHRTAPVLPTAVMTYANPVWRRGLAPTCRALAAAGAAGLIVPDLSLEESHPWQAAARSAGLDLVLLAAPGAGAARASAIAADSRGFLYLVSRYGTTGAGPAQGPTDLADIVRAARRGQPRLPVLLGFGVRDARATHAALRLGADGVVVGTALEERVAAGDSPGSVGRWLSTLTRVAAG